MKFGLTTVFSILSSVLVAQTIRLQTSNPAPRVGDEIYISITMEKNNLDSLEIAEDLVAQMMIPMMNKIGDAYIFLSDWFLTEEGPLSIGPIQIPLNNKVYKTDKLRMTVHPRLPADKREGIWVRTVELQGEHYIVLEQRKPREMIVRHNADGQPIMTFTNGTKEWAEVNMHIMADKFIEIEHHTSMFSTQDTDQGESTCKTTVYKYNPLKSFKGKLTIARDMLIYAPISVPFEFGHVRN